MKLKKIYIVTFDVNSVYDKRALGKIFLDLTRFKSNTEIAVLSVS